MSTSRRRAGAQATTDSRRSAFSRWRHCRPFWGAVLIALSGLELFFSGQLDIGKIHIQLGLEGLQATIIPLAVLLLGVLIALMPEHRVFYGIIALALAVYSLIGVNLGGFVIGMLLGAVGGVLAVARMPPKTADAGTDGGSAGPPVERPAAPVHHLYDEDAAHHAQPVIPPSLAHLVDETRPAETRPAEPDKAEQEQEQAETRRDAPAEASVPRRPRRHGGRVLRGSVWAAGAAIALTAASALPQAAQAATVSTGAEQAGCVLVIFCSPDSSSSPGPTPSSSPSPTPSDGGGLLAPGPTVQVPGSNRDSVPDDGQQPTTTAPADSDEPPLSNLGDDNDHGIFTLPSADVTGSTASIGGVPNAAVVSVPLADGTRTTAIRVECDSLDMEGFTLSTENRGDGVRLTTHMTLRGHVVIWINRIGTQWGDGEGLDKSLQENPLSLGQLMTLLGQGHVVLGLVGAQADTLTYQDFSEKVDG